MYCKHYGFSEKPFEVTPDPKFLYLSSIHREVHSTLLYGIRERRGFIVVLGEAGTGKTTLLRSVLEQLEEDVKVANIFDTMVTFDDFLQMVLIDLELANEGEKLGKVAAVQRLNELAIEQLRKRGTVVIIVDEAQNLGRDCMENLRLLSNLETSKTKLLQIMLFGQPELEDKLRRPDLRQLRQRINLRRYLLPMNEKETYVYIRHRLNEALYKGPTLFTGGAQKLIWKYSGGIPRMINTVCDNALLTGYALKRRKINKSVVREVIDDLTRNPFAERTAKRPDRSVGPFPRPEADLARHRSWSMKALLLVAGLILLAGIGLLTWRQHWNEKSTAALSDRFKITETEVRPPPSDIALPPPSSATDIKRESSPDAVLATTTATDPPPFFQPLPDPILNETSPLPAPEANLTQSEAKEHLFVAAEEPVVESRSQKLTTVRVRNGESISSIMIRKFGKYDKALEQEILLANPSIKSPDFVYVGQIIVIPHEPPAPERQPERP